MPSVVSLYLFFFLIIRIVHFSILNFIPIFWLYILIACISSSSSSSSSNNNNNNNDHNNNDNNKYFHYYSIFSFTFDFLQSFIRFLL